jgi:hypothetical protein
MGKAETKLSRKEREENGGNVFFFFFASFEEESVAYALDKVRGTTT